jgi:hypothetical protein
VNEMTGKGSNYLKAYAEGKKLTSSQAIQAKCADCMADYIDGRDDCNTPLCPLYDRMPYSSQKRKPNPKRSAAVKKSMAERKRDKHDTM